MLHYNDETFFAADDNAGIPIAAFYNLSEAERYCEKKLRKLLPTLELDQYAYDLYDIFDNEEIITKYQNSSNIDDIIEDVIDSLRLEFFTVTKVSLL